MDVDWKATWRSNLLMDFHQTCYFAKNDMRELNPLWRGMVERKDYAGLAISWLIAADAAEKTIGNQKNGYIWLSAMELLVVSRNSRNYKVGFPVLVIKF